MVKLDVEDILSISDKTVYTSTVSTIPENIQRFIVQMLTIIYDTMNVDIKKHKFTLRANCYGREDGTIIYPLDGHVSKSAKRLIVNIGCKDLYSVVTRDVAEYVKVKQENDKIREERADKSNEFNQKKLLEFPKLRPDREYTLESGDYIFVEGEYVYLTLFKVANNTIVNRRTPRGSFSIMRPRNYKRTTIVFDCDIIAPPEEETANISE